MRITYHLSVYMPVLFEQSSDNIAEPKVEPKVAPKADDVIEVKKSFPKHKTDADTIGFSIKELLRHPFRTFISHPKDIRFETQEVEEEIILFLRQDLVTLIPWIFAIGGLAIAPMIILPLFQKYLVLPIPIPATYYVVGTAFWYVMVFGLVLSQLLHWYFNIFIVSNERIIDIDFVHLLYKKFSETRLDRVQDIKYTMSGLAATIFNYGNVVIQTAGEVPNFVFESVPYPEKVVDVISDLVKIEHDKE